MEGICCYLEIDKGKVLQQYLNNSFSFKTSTSLFYALPNNKLCSKKLWFLIRWNTIFDISQAIFQQKSQEWMQKHICEKLILSNLTKSLEKGLVLVTSSNLFKTLTKGIGLVTSSCIKQATCINIFLILNF